MSALTQHLDCCSYRLDAWWLGLAHEKLVRQRYRPDFSDYRRGIHLGAYGWLEDARPRSTPPQPVTLPGELEPIFNPPGSTPLLAAPGSDGFLHAPSLNHAATAAILRTGFLANATPANPGSLSVKLDSERVRLARSFLEGIRSGQSLGALLGYQFERGLHDRHAQAEVDRFIHALRRFFPLRGTKPAEGVPIEAIEARNVIDGLALLRHVTRRGNRRFPFGLDIPLDPPEPSAQQLAAIDTEVERLIDINDALADLAVAESVHQMVQGNMDRAGATLDAFSKAGATGGGPPPDPDVVTTPRSGTSLTQRVGLHLPADARPDSSPIPGMAMTPRAQADPAVNAWLAGLLPRPETVACRVTWTDPATGEARERVVSQADLELQPIDLLWTLRPEDRAAMSDLDDRIAGHLARESAARPDAELNLRYTDTVPDRTTFFQLSPMVAALRSLLVAARPVKPTDLAPPALAEPVDTALDERIDLPRDRPASVRDRLRDLRDALVSFLADLGGLVADLEANRATLLSTVDTWLARLAGLLGDASGFGMLRSGWSEFSTWRFRGYRDLLAELTGITSRMAGALSKADTVIAEYDALPPETEAGSRLRLLRRAQRLLSTEPASPQATPEQLRDTISGLRRDFTERLSALTAVGSDSPATLAGLLAAVRELLPLNRFDPAGLDLAPHEDRVVAFCADLLERARSTEHEATTRLDAADTALGAYDAADAGPGRAEAATGAIRAVLGRDALATTEFTLPEAMTAPWRRVLEAAERGDLTGHLDRDFPADDWLHGVARVRDNMRHWERVTLLSGAVGEFEPALLPAQFPYQDGDPWLGLELPGGHEIDGDHLLYTAHYPDRFSPDGTLSALLLDEWTEVIPARGETSGLAVSVDRPGTQPPQSMLLVTPPVQTGTWRWDDLVAAVNETLDLARIRLVEPAHLEATPYVHLLPATTMTSTRHPITISTDLAVNNLNLAASDLGSDNA
ncbi:MAG TPA: hypothetical protein VF062_20310 [Candidatus Limnocylindrales bacterium]